MYNYNPKHHLTELLECHTIEVTEFDYNLDRPYAIGTMSEQSAKAFIAGYSDITVDKIIFDDGHDYIAFCIDGRDNMDWFYDTLVKLVYLID